jgi:hypothetical protein
VCLRLRRGGDRRYERGRECEQRHEGTHDLSHKFSPRALDGQDFEVTLGPDRPDKRGEERAKTSLCDSRFR